MSLLLFKLIAAAILFLTAWLMGKLPKPLIATYQPHLTLADAFAGGVFLGAAFFHMLPTAVDNFSSLGLTHTYLIAIAAIAISWLIIGGLEYSLSYLVQQQYRSYFSSYLLALVLAIHSLIEGAALGINTLFANALVIFIAIIAHKGCASFALAAALQKAALPKNKIKLMMLLFSLMTPIGVLASTFIMQTSSFKNGQWAEGLFNAFAAGTFLYLGIVHNLREYYINLRQYNYKTFAILGLGFLIMAIIAIWA